MIKYELTQGSDEWHEFRKSGVGSSDIAKIMGVSTFGTALDVFNEKAGLSPDKEQTYAMSRGTYYESMVLDKVNQFYDGEYKYQPTCGRNTEYPWAIASFDGYSSCGVLEIKVPGEKEMELARQNRMSEYYRMQVQWQLFVSGAIEATYVCYKPETDELYEIEVIRDPVLIEKMRAESAKFWNNFLNGIPPASPKKDYDIISDNMALEACIDLYKYAKSKQVEYDQLVELRKADILMHGNGNSFRAYGITVCKTDGRTTYDIDAMKAHGIDVEKYAKFGKESYAIKIDK